MELVLSIQGHDLTKPIHCLETLWQDTCDTELELLEHREQVLGHRPGLKPPLDGAAHAERLTVAEGSLHDAIEYGHTDELRHLLPCLDQLVAELGLLAWPDHGGHLLSERILFAGLACIPSPVTLLLPLIPTTFLIDP